MPTIIDILKYSKPDSEKIKEIEALLKQQNVSLEAIAPHDLAIRAAITCGTVMFKWLLDQPIKPNFFSARTSDGDNIIFIALRASNEVVFEMFCSSETGRKKFLLTKNNFNETAIHLAVQGNSTKNIQNCVTLLGSDCLLQPNRDGDIPIVTAAKLNKPSLFFLLLRLHLDAGKQPNINPSINYTMKAIEALHKEDLLQRVHDTKGFYLIHYVTEAGNLDALKYLIETAKISVPQLTAGSNKSPLFTAANSGQSNCFNYLLSQYKDNERQDALKAVTSTGRTLAFAAACGNSRDIIKLLHDNEIPLNKANNDGWCPIHAAASIGKLEALKALIEFDPLTISQKNEKAWDHDALFVAAFAGQTAIFDYLLSRLSKVGLQELTKRTNTRGETIISGAIEKGHVCILESLTKKGISLDQPDYKGWRPIHYAASFGSTTALNFLFTKCMIMVPTMEKETPISLAIQKGHTECVKLLLEKSAFMNWYVSPTETLLTLAVTHGQVGIVKLLFSFYDKMKSAFTAAGMGNFERLNQQILDDYPVYRLFDGLKTGKIDQQKFLTIAEQLLTVFVKGGWNITQGLRGNIFTYIETNSSIDIITYCKLTLTILQKHGDNTSLNKIHDQVIKMLATKHANCIKNIKVFSSTLATIGAMMKNFPTHIYRPLLGAHIHILFNHLINEIIKNNNNKIYRPSKDLFNALTSLVQFLASTLKEEEKYLLTMPSTILKKDIIDSIIKCIFLNNISDKLEVYFPLTKALQLLIPHNGQEKNYGMQDNMDPTPSSLALFFTSYIKQCWPHYYLRIVNNYRDYLLENDRDVFFKGGMAINYNFKNCLDLFRNNSPQEPYFAMGSNVDFKKRNSVAFYNYVQNVIYTAFDSNMNKFETLLPSQLFQSAWTLYPYVLTLDKSQLSNIMPVLIKVITVAVTRNISGAYSLLPLIEKVLDFCYVKLNPEQQKRLINYETNYPGSAKPIRSLLVLAANAVVRNRDKFSFKGPDDKEWADDHKIYCTNFFRTGLRRELGKEDNYQTTKEKRRLNNCSDIMESFFKEKNMWLIKDTGENNTKAAMQKK